MDIDSIKIQFFPGARSIIHLRGRPRQWEDEYRINEIIKGRAEYRFDKGRQEVKAGDLVFFKPGWRTITCAPSMDVLSIRFDLPNEEQVGGLRQLLPPCIVFSGTPKEKAVLKNALKDARDEMALSRKPGRARLHLRVALSFFLTDELENPPAPLIPEKLTEVARELTLHPERRLKASEMSKMAGCSGRQLYRLFIKFYGASPSNYAIRQRIRHAKDLLLHEGASVKDTAYSLGYPNPYSFSLQFRKVVGTAPSMIKNGD